MLVTGAAGFAGPHLLQRLTPARPGRGLASARFGATRPPPACAGRRWSCSIARRWASALADARPSAIYHLAGIAHVGDSWAHAEETLAGNVVGTSHLFDGAARRAAPRRVLVTGSADHLRGRRTLRSPRSRRWRPTRPTARASWRRRCCALGRLARARHARGRDPLVQSHRPAASRPPSPPPASPANWRVSKPALAPPSLLVGNLLARPATSATCATRCAPTWR